MRVEVEVVEEPKGVFTISVGKMDMFVVEACGMSVVAPKNFVFSKDLFWLMKAACDISHLLSRQAGSLEDVKKHISARESLFEAWR
jgi:hypothetical protein